MTESKPTGSAVEQGAEALHIFLTGGLTPYGQLDSHRRWMLESHVRVVVAAVKKAEGKGDD